MGITSSKLKCSFWPPRIIFLKKSIQSSLCHSFLFCSTNIIIPYLYLICTEEQNEVWADRKTITDVRDFSITASTTVLIQTLSLRNEMINLIKKMESKRFISSWPWQVNKFITVHRWLAFQSLVWNTIALLTPEKCNRSQCHKTIKTVIHMALDKIRSCVCVCKCISEKRTEKRGRKRATISTAGTIT